MTPGAIALAIFLVLLFGWIVWEIFRAPEGWQDDETGFHYGRNPEDDE